MAQLKSVCPVSNENTNSLPVKELGHAISYYESVLGFTLVSRALTTAVLRRDEAQIGLTVKGDHLPRDAGSLGFAVDDLDSLHHELSGRGANPGEFGIDEWGGKQHRTFFVREDWDGYCYCFYCSVEPYRDGYG